MWDEVGQGTIGQEGGVQRCSWTHLLVSVVFSWLA